MDFNKTRCSICFKHFCCIPHRSEHQVKVHTEISAQRHNNHLVQVVQQNTQSSLFWTQNNQKINNILRQSQVTHVSTVLPRRSSIIQLPSAKRLHSEINKRIFSTSETTVVSQQRKILVPVHRLELPYVLKDDNREVSSKDSDEVRKESSYVEGNVKTSTPIISPLPNHQSSQIIWDVSSESTISNYQTPSGPSPGSMTETNQLNVKSTKYQELATPLRGIIIKSSKYDSDSDTGRSPAINTSRSRKVTFSSSSQISSCTSTPLESIQEVEICEEIENTYNHFEDISAEVISRRSEDTESNNFIKIRKSLEDSTPPIKTNGFLSCVTNMFCSAIHTIPSLAPWRKTETDLLLSRSKRSRSPNGKEMHYLDIGTPLLKRPCYPSDLRKNPIQSRRPISER